MRLLSYNIQSLRGSRAGVIDALRAAAPDVVCLQEVPRFAFPAWRARRLARACGLVAVNHGRLALGTAIWMRPEIPVRRAAGLPLSRSTPRSRFPAPRLHRRGVSVARLVIGGRELTVASVHLGLDAAERARHAREALLAVTAFGWPYVVAGDLNEDPSGSAWEIFGAGAVPVNLDRPTFPSGDPTHVIDTVFVTAEIWVAAAVVLPTTASDHRPLQVTFAVRDSPEGPL